MKKFVVIVFLLVSSHVYAKDHSGDYQMGTFVTSAAVADGTTTDTFDCGPRSLGSIVCTGGMNINSVRVYRIRVAGGVWFLETLRQAQDSTFRSFAGEEPSHFRAEKDNPLDLLKNGDKVLFRVERHLKVTGIETDVAIPFADNPSKEAKFVGTFRPAVEPAQPSTLSDNVRAMCEAHKLSPDLQKKYCTP